MTFEQIEGEQNIIDKLNQDLADLSYTKVDKNKLVNALKADIQSIKGNEMEARLIYHKYLKEIKITEADISIVLLGDVTTSGSPGRV